MALVNQGLQFHNHVRIGRAQGNTDGGQALAQADGIHFVLSGVRRPNHTDPIAGTGSFQDIANAPGKNPSALSHKVNFHEMSPSADKGATFSEVAVSVR